MLPLIFLYMLFVSALGAFLTVNRIISYLCSQTDNQKPELHINQICQLYTCFPGDISSLLIVGKERRRIRIVHLTLSSSQQKLDRNESGRLLLTTIASYSVRKIIITLKCFL